MSILLTGGAGLIGSNFVLDWLAQSDEPVVNVDKLIDAGKLHNLDALNGNPAYVFVQADIGDRETISGLLREHDVGAVVHFAAESHVDRSIDGPSEFINTHVVGPTSCWKP